MNFYILLLLFISSLFLLGYFYPNKEKLLGLIVFVVITLVAGLRYRIGNDYNSYVSWYLYKTRDDNLEFGFVAIMDLFRWFNLSPFFLFFFFSFFTYFFVYLGIRKYTSHNNVELLFYILIPSLYISSFTFVRQSFSVAISFYSFYYLINRKYLVYFLLMFIGISIHNTCLIPFVVFIFIFRYIDKIKVNHMCILLIGTFVLSTLNFVEVFSILFDKTRYEYYFSNKRIPVNIFKLIVLNIVCFFTLYYYQKYRIKNLYKQYFLVLYVISIAFINILSSSIDLSRIYTYFRIFEIIVVADLIFSETNRKRICLFSFFYILYFTAFLNGLKIDSKIPYENIPKFIPYRSIFSKT